MFVAAANALTNSVLPDEPDADEKRNLERVRELVEHVTSAMALVMNVLQQAIMGHLKQYKTRLQE